MQIELAKIKIGPRMRQDVGDISNLTESIRRTKGRLVTVWVDSELNLVSGRRRIAACEAAGVAEVDARDAGALSEAERMELELEENLCRENLTDEELARGILALHQARQASAEPGQRWNLADTAGLIGLKKSQTALYVEVAEAMPRRMNVLKALQDAGISAAYKQLKYEEENEVQRELAKRGKLTTISMPAPAIPVSGKTQPAAAPAPTYKLSDFLLQADALEAIKSIPDLSQHIVFCDPPYGVGIDKIKNFGSFTGDHIYDDDFESVTLMLTKLAPELYRAVRADGWIFAWTSMPLLFGLYDLLTKVGFKMCQIPFIWKKERALHPCVDLDHRFANGYEIAIYGWKGNPSMAKKGQVNILSAGMPPNEVHPHAKPIELQAELLRRFVLPGSSVLDPFGGSFSVFKAALKAGMRCISFEKDPDYYSRGVVSVEDWIKKGMK